MNLFVKNNDNEYVNVRNIVSVGINPTAYSNTFEVTLDNKESIQFTFDSNEEMMDARAVLIEELLRSSHKWIVFERCGLAVRADEIRYVRHWGSGLKFSTTDGTWELQSLTDEQIATYIKRIVGNSQIADLEYVGLHSMFK